jgi:hypothetical protein
LVPRFYLLRRRQDEDRGGLADRESKESRMNGILPRLHLALTNQDSSPYIERERHA